MADCIFCKIANKEIPANIVYEDDKVLCFHDVAPKAPTHVLLISKKHIASMADVQTTDQELMGHIIVKIKEIAEVLELENGYRVVNNCGSDGGQTVDHIHFHIMGKRQMLWPPG